MTKPMTLLEYWVALDAVDHESPNYTFAKVFDGMHLSEAHNHLFEDFSRYFAGDGPRPLKPEAAPPEPKTYLFRHPSTGDVFTSLFTGGYEEALRFRDDLFDGAYEVFVRVTE